MDAQPGHFLRCPGIEEKVPYEPEDNADLLVQRHEQEVIIPWLAATGDLLLLYPVIQALPDAVTNTIFDIGEEDGKQDQEDGPGHKNGEEPVRPGHCQNGI